MKETLHLQIDQPCHENWNTMTASEQGRFCQSCCKTVVDFSIMTDREIMDYISLKAGGDTCARAHDGQLNRLIQRPPERKAGWKYFWSLALSSLLISYRSIGQVKQPVPKSTFVVPNTTLPEDVIVMGKIASRLPHAGIPAELSGRVVDEQGQPVAYATVSLKHPDVVVTADSAGWYSFRATDVTKLQLSYSAVGYETTPLVKFDVQLVQSPEVNKAGFIKSELADKALKRDTKQLEEVVVIGYATTHCTRITGAMSMVRSYTLLDKVKDTIIAITGKSAIKTYPNPAPADGSFNVQFDVKEAGEYNVQFIDASGRIVAGKQLTITARGQVETFPAASLKGHGMYFIRVAGKKDGKVYTTKFIVG